MREEVKGTYPLDVYPIKSGASPVEGDMIAINASKEALPAADAAGITVAGVAIRVNTASVEVRDGVFAFANSENNALDRDDRGKLCYVEDKDTVSSVGGTNAVVAGVVVDVYNEDVYVDNSPAAIAAATGKNPVAGVVAAPAAITAANPAAITAGTPTGGATNDAEARAEVVKLVTDLTASRAEVVKLVTDLTATRTAVTSVLTALKTAGLMASA